MYICNENDLYDGELEYKRQFVDFRCETATCELESKRLMDIMDMQADPCENFAEFVCGKYYQNDTLLQNDTSHWLTSIGTENRK